GIVYGKLPVLTRSFNCRDTGEINLTKSQYQFPISPTTVKFWDWK
ncbi:4476_t:CDS:1, partial [Cetraspora pellucida]